MSARSAVSVSRVSRSRLGWVLVLFLDLLTSSAIGADTLQPIRADGATELTIGLPSANPIHVTIWQARMGVGAPYKDPVLWGGDVGQPPPTVLSSIQILNGSEAIPIPLSAYGDLGDVRWASINSTREGYRLSLHGGETATSYDAELNFAKGVLKTRVVRLREFPQQRWEKTTYSFTTGN
jgi:hypothetical protein